MKKSYVVSKDENGRWYAHKAGFSYVPVMGSFGTKKHALQSAADCMHLPYKEYMKL